MGSLSHTWGSQAVQISVSVCFGVWGLFAFRVCGVGWLQVPTFGLAVVDDRSGQVAEVQVGLDGSSHPDRGGQRNWQARDQEVELVDERMPANPAHWRATKGFRA